MTSCKICGSDKYKRLFELDCGSFDNSKLYKTVKINCCNNCGHIYNDLLYDDLYDLTKYYEEEYAQCNLESNDKEGDRPGTINKLTIERYEELFSLAPIFNKDSKILDVGCACSGFLNFLKEKGYNDLHGIDMIKKYVDYSNKHYDFDVKVADVYYIPFKENTFDVIFIDQVFEHLFNPIIALMEIKRVLKPNGVVVVGVPDAGRYNKYGFFPFYWFLMREHIQHFDLEHLEFLFEQLGFSTIRHGRTENRVLSENMIMPNLNVSFLLNNSMKYSKLETEIINYYEKEKDRLHKTIEHIIMSLNFGGKIYVWGLGREFLLLFDRILDGFNLTLIDDTPIKQEKFTIKKNKIHDSSVLRSADENSLLIITAKAHYKKLKNKAIEIGFKGDIIGV